MAARFRTQANLCALLVPVAFLGGVLGLAFTWWLCFVASWLGLHSLGALAEMFGGHRWHLSSRWPVGLAWAGFLTLVAGFLKSGTRDLDHYPEFEGSEPSWDDAARVGLYAGSPAVLLMFPHASARMILDILYLAPRMVRGAWVLLRSSGDLRTIDPSPAAEVLAALSVLPGKLPWEEFGPRFGHLPVAEVRRALRWIPGVVNLEGGLTLDADLRAELRGVGRGDGDPATEEGGDGTEFGG
jgi:hypothetical protein